MVRDTVMPEASRDIPTATVTVPKTAASKPAKRAEVN
jgi:hypothetical protein